MALRIDHLAAPIEAWAKLADHGTIAPEAGLQEDATYAVVKHAVGAGMQMIPADLTMSIEVGDPLGSGRAAMGATRLARFE
jgi:hypothetical protein